MGAVGARLSVGRRRRRRSQINDHRVDLIDCADLDRILRQPIRLDRRIATFPVVAFEPQRATGGLFDLVGNDVVVGEREPEAATGAAGLERRPAVHKGPPNRRRSTNVELRARGALAAVRRDENASREKEARHQHRDGRADEQLDIGTTRRRGRQHANLGYGEPMLRRYRVVIAKPGLDGHDRGAKVIARALRDAGFEVVYTGLFQTAESVAEAALQEDADAVGLSVLSGAHMTLIPAVVAELRARELTDVLVFAGGIIPDDDRPALEAAGVAGVFTPGVQLAEIVAWLEAALDRRERQLTA